MIKVNIRNHSTVVSDSDIGDIVEALQHQVTVDFCAIWKLGEVSLAVVPNNAPEEFGVWELVFFDTSDQAGALGYHDLTSNGDPIGKVFCKDDITSGSAVSVTASHELLEMLADPFISLAAEVSDASGKSKWYAYEVCDACEDDQFGYNITIPTGRQILVSDFVTPWWFLPDAPTNVAFDVRGYITAPLQLLVNGYIGLNEGNGWTQVTARISTDVGLRKAQPKLGHRRERRARGHQAWKRSIMR